MVLRIVNQVKDNIINDDENKNMDIGIGAIVGGNSNAVGDGKRLK
jgi:hypothetical protein